MKIEQYEVTNVLTDSGEQLESGDLVVVSDSVDRDLICRYIGLDKGLIVFGKLGNSEEFKLRASAIKGMELADVVLNEREE